jgi:alpha-beta hydrolase superfamily lysophospholipase
LALSALTYAVTAKPAESADIAIALVSSTTTQKSCIGSRKTARAPAAMRRSFCWVTAFGGLLAGRTLTDSARDYKGAILSSPLFGLALEVSSVKVLAGKIASRVYPKLGLPSGLAGKDMTHDRDRAKAYDEDPLVFKKARARWFTEMQESVKESFDRAARIELPLYMAFGTEDPVNSFAAGKRFFDAISSKDKTWDAREGKFHELLNETDWKDLVEKYAKFVLSHA